MSHVPHPQFDPELAAALAGLDGIMTGTVTADMIPEYRALPHSSSSREELEAEGVATRDVTIPTFDGASIVLSIVERPGRSGVGACIFFIHGGGMISGNRWLGAHEFPPQVLHDDAVLVLVEYRLAPEHPDPVPVEDCYAALIWTAAHAEDLSFDPERLLLAGSSAGGGLAAGVALMARDRSGPTVCAQLLICPMLDDRDKTVSTRQFADHGLWTRGTNTTAWQALLGTRKGTDDVSSYAAPARATDLSGLPPAYIDCGSAELFRDEDVAYAHGIWAAGGKADLHVWTGGYHSFDEFAPHAQISRQSRSTRQAWINKILAR
ncbi:MAG: alpha/beta hydrolase fold domain-containing protein [Galactobacter sp.]